MQDEYVNGDAMIREEIEKCERIIEDVRSGRFEMGETYPIDRDKQIASLEARIANLRSQLSGG
jgi:hypothetical protein